ncbi:MAG: tRNA uridine-5-carboxymethylaminomethyl(34) synthesis GTPase MnmE, partial [Spirochaetales bacterium]|nr:tRNA uridine-5-carboxymethylaminomethyl(34) synthesis GTPase MnmE [Spirochaetales bacterium]
MELNGYDTEDDIFALATPPGESALAVIRLSGPETIGKFALLFSEPEWCKKAEGGRIRLGYIKDGGSRIDQVMAGLYRGPASYSGQDMIEIFCHGSMAGVNMLRNLLRRSGFRDAHAGEFTYRAFINRKMDLTQAEAVQEIVKSRSVRAHQLALDRLSGGIRDTVLSIKDELMQIVSTVELQLDYPEDEIEETTELPVGPLLQIIGHVQDLLKTYNSGKIFRDGVKVVLAGKTNSGKSSLFNLFLKEDRAIVSDVHGTTRDFLEAWISIDGLPVILFDTAGLRGADNPVEEEGIRRSRAKIEEGHIVIYLIDGETGVTEDDRVTISGLDGKNRVITVWNKTDKYKMPEDAGFIAVSASTGEGFHKLEKAVRTLALGTGTDPADVIIDSERQKLLFEECSEYLEHAVKSLKDFVPLDAIASDLRGALDALGRITGEITSADVLEYMFSSFCVGK